MSSKKPKGDLFSGGKKGFYPCSECDAAIPKGKSQCLKCKVWNFPNTASGGKDGVVKLSDAPSAELTRYKTGPWDRVWGGGIVQTSTTLLAGCPGAGKSTLALQLTDGICEFTKREVLYVATEEDLSQIRARAIRLGLKHVDRMLMLPMGEVQNMTAAIMNRKPCAIVLDSLSKLVGTDLDAGSTFLGRAKEYAVELKSPFVVIDHITKEGDLAGLEEWQHAVDATLMFEVFDNVRVLLAKKNRNGEAFIQVHFDMTAQGLIARESCPKCGGYGCECQGGRR